MKILQEYPPIFASARELLAFDEKTTIFTYGDTIYNPSGVLVGPDLIAHEKVHMEQQKKMGILGKFGSARWWKRFLHDPKFRLEQELEAYRVQYKWAKRNIRGKNQLFNYGMALARHLTGPMYGNLEMPLMKAYNAIVQ